ncbi:MAG: hypothetical protein LBO72_09215, partial [Helicobacteraceae bacterium]|nr:hypothetical protein [Helicobacteraceae bacterium]
IRSSKGKASWRQIHKNLLAAMEQKGEISTDDYIAIFMGKTKPPFSFRVVQARSSKLTRPKMQSVFIR